MNNPSALHTKWGKTYINPCGHHQIVSGVNQGKLLHRLIYESVWGKIPETHVIHHIDGDKTNNCILNLLMVSKEHHSSLHNKGMKIPLDLCKKRSMDTSSTGYYRVVKEKSKTCKKGFTWAYQYRVDNKFKRIRSVDITKLEKKVIAKGLPWFKFEGVEI